MIISFNIESFKNLSNLIVLTATASFDIKFLPLCISPNVPYPIPSIRI